MPVQMVSSGASTELDCLTALRRPLAVPCKKTMSSSFSESGSEATESGFWVLDHDQKECIQSCCQNSRGVGSGHDLENMVFY